jgi:hypothetical protein
MADYSPVYSGGVLPFSVTTSGAVTGGNVLVWSGANTVANAGADSAVVAGVAAQDASPVGRSRCGPSRVASTNCSLRARSLPGLVSSLTPPPARSRPPPSPPQPRPAPSSGPPSPRLPVPLPSSASTDAANPKGDKACRSSLRPPFRATSSDQSVPREPDCHPAPPARLQGPPVRCGPDPHAAVPLIRRGGALRPERALRHRPRGRGRRAGV